MAFINDQPIVELIGENSHVIELNFTINNYHGIISLDFIREHRILCERFETEWTVWILFQKENPDQPISSIVSISRTDEEDIKVLVNLSMSLYNVSTPASVEVLDVSTTEIGKGWEFQKYLDPLLELENSAILNGWKFRCEVHLNCFRLSWLEKGGEKVVKYSKKILLRRIFLKYADFIRSHKKKISQISNQSRTNV